MIAYNRRATITHRVEFVIPRPDDGRDLTMSDVTNVYAAVTRELDLRGYPAASTTVRVSATPDGGVVIYYEHVAAHPSTDSRTREALRAELVAALGDVHADVPWSRLLDEVDARSQVAREVTARRRLADAEGDPIPALLPRDWPRRLLREVEAFEGSLRVTRLQRLIDDWVLAAADDVEDDGTVR